MSDRTYADLEREALDALAMRTMSDPASDPEHVQAARARLLHLDVQRLASRVDASTLSPAAFALIRDALAERRERRDGAVPDPAPTD